MKICHRLDVSGFEIGEVVVGQNIHVDIRHLVDAKFYHFIRQPFEVRFQLGRSLLQSLILLIGEELDRFEGHLGNLAINPITEHDFESNHNLIFWDHNFVLSIFILVVLAEELFANLFFVLVKELVLCNVMIVCFGPHTTNLGL